ncbi:MAG: hypothetical protein QM658_18110, partial [Gordonia sp. (in: high G+C Gram-positive bacteria)]
MAWPTYLVDAVDVTEVDGVEGVDASTLLALPAAPRGSLPTADGIHGAQYVPLPREAKVLTLSVSGLSADVDTSELMQGLTSWAKPGRAVTLTRRRLNGEDEQEHTASATLWDIYEGQRIGLRGVAATLEFVVLDGCFCDSSVTIADASGTHSVEGTVTTRRMTITFSAAATLTNSTNGYSCTVDAAGTVDV